MVDIKFDTQTGKIVLSVDNTALVGALSTDEHYFKLTDPLGSIAKNSDFTTADFTGTAGSVTLNIPKDSLKVNLTGTYSVEYRYNGALGANLDQSFTYDFSPEVSIITPSVSSVTFCSAGKLVVTDDTTWPAGVTRLMTIQPPPLPNNATPAAITGAGPRIEYPETGSAEWHNINIDVTVDVSKTTTTTILTHVTLVDFTGTILDYRQYALAKLFLCDQDACMIISCIDNAIRAKLDQACKTGGIFNMSLESKERLQLIQIYLLMYKFNQDNENYSAAEYWYNKLKEIADLEGCQYPTGPLSLNASDTVVLITGPQGPPGQSAYELYLELGGTGSEEDFINAASGGGTWVDISGTEINGADASSGTYRLRYKLENSSDIRVEGFLNIPATVGSLQFVASGTIPSGLRPNNSHRRIVYNSNGEEVGTIDIRTDGGIDYNTPPSGNANIDVYFDARIPVDNTPPNIDTIEVLVATPTLLRFTFTAALDALTLPTLTAFTVRVNGVERADVAFTPVATPTSFTFDMALISAVSSGDEVRVDYNPALSTNKLTGVNGLTVPAFTNILATNAL